MTSKDNSWEDRYTEFVEDNTQSGWFDFLTDREDPVNFLKSFIQKERSLAYQEGVESERKRVLEIIMKEMGSPVTGWTRAYLEISTLPTGGGEEKPLTPLSE